LFLFVFGPVLLEVLVLRLDLNVDEELVGGELDNVGKARV